MSNVEWELSTNNLEAMVLALRNVSAEEKPLDVVALCDEAADFIEGLMHYEQSHGLRS